MEALTYVASGIVMLYIATACLLYFFQTRLLFFPGKLDSDHRYKENPPREEVWLKTDDGETLNALFFPGMSNYVVLYFHGNAGDLSGWQFIAEDLAETGLNLLILDYRGYGKSTGMISEKGFALDADASLRYLIDEKRFREAEIIIYGRSIGTGVAVDLAQNRSIRGLILEAPFSSLGKLANEKLPFFFPSLYLRSKFDNLKKMEKIRCPVAFVHGTADTLIPAAHSRILHEAYSGKKTLVLVPNGDHNGLSEHRAYKEFVRDGLSGFFQLER